MTIAASGPTLAVVAPTSGDADTEPNLKAFYGLLGVVAAFYGPWVPLLLQGEGLDPKAIGVALAAIASCAAVATALWGNIADNHIGTVRALRLVYASACCAAVVATIVHSVTWAAISAIVVIGVVISPTPGLADTLVLTQLGVSRAQHYGTIRLFSSAGWAATVWIDGLVLERAGLWLAFPCYASGLAALVLTLRRFPSRNPRIHVARSHSPLAAARAAFATEPMFAPYLLGVLLIGMATFAAWNFVPLRITSPFLVGVAVGVGAAFEVPVMYWCSHITGRIGLRATFAVGTGLYALQMLLWAVVADPAVASLILMTRGLALGAAYVSTVRIAGRLMPAHLQNSGQLLTQMALVGVGPVLGAIMGGVLYSTWGAPVMFLVCAMFTMAGTGIVWRALPGAEFMRPVRQAA